MRPQPRCQFSSTDGQTLFEFMLGGGVRIGRAATNDLVLEDSSVSRHHARVLWEVGSGYPVIHNSGSANGVKVDGARVFDSAPLREGARLELGRVVLRVRLLDVSLEEISPPDGMRPDSGRVSSAILSGRVTPERPLRLILRWLESRQATGTVRIEAPEGRVDFGFRLGQIIRLASPWGEDLSAFQRSLQVGDASYGLLPFLDEYEGTAPPLNLWVNDLLDGSEGDETERLLPDDL